MGMGTGMDEIKVKNNKFKIRIGYKNKSINPKTKHMDIRVHYARELIKENKIKLEYIKSHENLADGFTKYLNNTAMDNFRNSLLVKLNNLDI